MPAQWEVRDVRLAIQEPTILRKVRASRLVWCPILHYKTLYSQSFEPFLPTTTSLPSGSFGCDKCSTGKYYEEEANTCKSCPLGKFTPTGENNIDNCRDCEPGFISNNFDGAGFCSPCQAGSFANPSQTECLLCAPGFISGIASTECAACEKGEDGRQLK